MVIFLIAVLLTLFAILGLLAWFVLYLFKFRGYGRRVFRVTAVGFILFTPFFIFFLSPITISYLIANASTRPQDRLLSNTPSMFGCEYMPVEFLSRDQLLLSGWLIKGDLSRPPILFGHGLFRNRQEVLERACHLNRHGFSVLVFDFRNHGDSESRRVSLGYQERLDVLGAADYLTSTLGKEEVVLAGVSLGAVAVIMATPECADRVRAVVADSPFDSLHETVRRHMELFLTLPRVPFLNLFVWNLAREAGFEAEKLDTVSTLRRVGRTPILLIYGKEDNRMPESVAQRLYTAIPGPHKELVFFEKAGHGDAYESAPDRYVKHILDFIGETEPK